MSLPDLVALARTNVKGVGRTLHRDVLAVQYELGQITADEYKAELVRLFKLQKRSERYKANKKQAENV